MARMIGRTKSWLAWLAGSVLALVFGSAGCGKDERPAPVYGAPPAPPAGKPDTPTGSLEDSKDWKVITGAWDFCMPLATSGKSTEAQRKEADKQLKAAQESSDRLVKAGLLTVAEAGLLAAEAEKIKADIYRNPPTDTEVRCYQAMLIIPAQDSLARLNQRLPFLEALVKDGKIQRGTADKVLASIEADLAVLSDPKELAKLSDEKKRAEAEKTRDAVKAEVEKLRKLLEAPKP